MDEGASAVVDERMTHGETTQPISMRYRAETSSLATNSMACRSIARAWNVSADENPDWRAQRLTEPPLKARRVRRGMSFPRACAGTSISISPD
jgi:hypothetical protein